jgi:hypothetical protein
MAKPRYRVGRSLGRTIYQGPESTDVIGMMDTPDLAALVVAALNAYPATLFGERVLECVHMTEPVVDNDRRRVRFALLTVDAPDG